MNEITIPQYDHGFNLAANLQDNSGDIKVLSGYTVTFKAWAAGTPSTVLVSAACTVVNNNSGTITCAVASGHFSSAGQYMAEFQASKSGVVETFESFKVKVRESPA